MSGEQTRIKRSMSSAVTPPPQAKLSLTHVADAKSLNPSPLISPRANNSPVNDFINTELKRTSSPNVSKRKSSARKNNTLDLQMGSVDEDCIVTADFIPEEFNSKSPSITAVGIITDQKCLNSFPNSIIGTTFFYSADFTDRKSNSSLPLEMVKLGQYPNETCSNTRIPDLKTLAFPLPFSSGCSEIKQEAQVLSWCVELIEGGILFGCTLVIMQSIFDLKPSDSKSERESGKGEYYVPSALVVVSKFPIQMSLETFLLAYAQERKGIITRDDCYSIYDLLSAKFEDKVEVIFAGKSFSFCLKADDFSSELDREERVLYKHLAAFCTMIEVDPDWFQRDISSLFDAGNYKTNSILQEKLPMKEVARLPFKSSFKDAYPNEIASMIYPFGMTIQTSNSSPAFIPYVFTIGSGRRLYGYSVQMFRKATTLEHRFIQLHYGTYVMQQSRPESDKMPDQFYIPVCMIILSALPFHSTFNLFLREFIDKYEEINSEMCELAYNILRVPLRNTVLFTRVGTQNEMIEFAFPDSGERLIDIDYRILFSRLSPENISRLFQALLLEQSILLITESAEILSICTETLLSFLYPFEWPWTYIPVLSVLHGEILESPHPFIIGATKLTLSQLNQKGIDAIFVDLDSDSIMAGKNFPLLFESDHYYSLKLQNGISKYFNIYSFINHDLLDHDVKDSEIQFDDIRDFYSDDGETVTSNSTGITQAANIDFLRKESKSHRITNAPEKFNRLKSVNSSNQLLVANSFSLRIDPLNLRLVFESIIVSIFCLYRKHLDLSLDEPVFDDAGFLEKIQSHKRGVAQQILGTQIWSYFLQKRSISNLDRFEHSCWKRLQRNRAVYKDYEGIRFGKLWIRAENAPIWSKCHALLDEKSKCFFVFADSRKIENRFKDLNSGSEKEREVALWYLRRNIEDRRESIRLDNAIVDVMYLRLKNETPPEKFTFVLIERGRRLFLCAKSKESRRDWIKSINSRLLKLDQILPDDIYGESPKQQNETLSNPAIMMSKLATFQKNTPRISTIGRMRAQSASLERKSSAPKPQVLKEKSLKGWLTQHYGVSRKLQRYFILKSRNLHVYHAVPQASESMKNLQKQRSDSLDNSDAISTFTVKDCTVTVLREENFEFGFRISSRLHKMSLYLSSFSKDERDQWLDALETEGALVIRVENEPCFQGELFLVSKRRHVLVSLNVSSVQIDGEDYSWESIFVHDSGNVIFMSFENRVLQLETESKEIHQLWLLKISFFLQAYYMLSKHSITSRIGWIHWFLRNSIHSYSYTGDFQGLKSYVSFLGDSYVHAIDSKDDEEYTAIHLACHQGHLEIVEYLIDLKASLLLKDPNGNPPAHIAAARADGDLLKLIIGKGGYHLYSALNSKDQKVLWALGFSGSPITKIGDSLKCISEIKCNIDEYDDASGLTLLQTAASANLYKILEILLQNGSDLSKLSKTGAQSIHLAAAAEAEEAMVILLKYGAQPNMKDVNGKSPLDHLPFNLDVDNPLAVLLTEHGARWDNSKEDRKRDLIALSPKLLKAEELYKDLGKAKGSLRATYFKEITLDSQSFCMICSSSFGALSPRRRCDHCGLIICVLCATKKYRELEKEDSKHTCCDGCFNKLRYLHGQAESRKSLGPLGFLKVPRYSFGERMVEKVNRMLK